MDELSLNTRIIARLRAVEKKKIELVAENNVDRFDSGSHFVRCAVIEKLRRYDDEGNACE